MALNPDPQNAARFAVRLSTLAMRISSSLFLRAFLALLPGIILFVVIETVTTDKNTADYSFLVVAPLCLAGFPWNIGALLMAIPIKDHLPPTIVDVAAAIVLFSCAFINSYLIARASPMSVTSLALFLLFLALPFVVFLSNG